MNEKLAKLHKLLRVDPDKQALFHNPQIMELINEILGVYGLSLNPYIEKMLTDFAKINPITEEIIDDTIIRLADEAADALTAFKLE
jgi:hypothetical protein